MEGGEYTNSQNHDEDGGYGFHRAPGLYLNPVHLALSNGAYTLLTWQTNQKSPPS
jgi:hypothetical protein